jgi:hypothetical protein
MNYFFMENLSLIEGVYTFTQLRFRSGLMPLFKYVVVVVLSHLGRRKKGERREEGEMVD